MYEIKNFRKNTGSGRTKGFFTLQIGDFELNDFTLVSGDKGLFIGFPQRKYTDKEGADKWANIVFIPDKDRRYAFQDWALKELEKLDVEPEAEGQEEIPF